MITLPRLGLIGVATATRSRAGGIGEQYYAE
jgi:hypothetical protein